MRLEFLWKYVIIIIDQISWKPAFSQHGEPLSVSQNIFLDISHPKYLIIRPDLLIPLSPYVGYIEVQPPDWSESVILSSD